MWLFDVVKYITVNKIKTDFLEILHLHYKTCVLQVLEALVLAAQCFVLCFHPLTPSCFLNDLYSVTCFVNISSLLSWRSSNSRHLTFLQPASPSEGVVSPIYFSNSHSLIYFSKYHRDAFTSVLHNTLHSHGYETNQHPATERWTECGPQAVESHRVTTEN